MLARLRSWWDRRRGHGIRAFFRGGPDDPEAGVREPRRPLEPSLSGAVALDEPHDDEAVR
jgi:hypothetical protein